MDIFGGMQSLFTGAKQEFDKFGLGGLAAAAKPGGARASDAARQGPLANPFIPRAMTSAMAQMAFPALSFGRNAVDATMYDIGALSDRERSALSKRRAEPGQIVVVHPQGVRAPAVYHSVGEFAISVDGQTRIAAQVGPGATLLGIAAFARDVANAMGEPVAAPVPSFTPADVAAAMNGTYFRCDPGDLSADDPLRPEEQTLLDLLTNRPSAFRLVVAHGLGARALARTLFAEVEQARREGAHSPDYSRHLVTFGAAPRLPARFEATRIVGAADPIGWSLTDTAVEVDVAPAGVGHHTNTQLPGALSVSGILSKVEQLEARPASGSRRKVDSQTASFHD